MKDEPNTWAGTCESCQSAVVCDQCASPVQTDFKKQVYQTAFGYNAHRRDFSDREVLQRLAQCYTVDEWRLFNGTSNDK